MRFILYFFVFTTLSGCFDYQTNKTNHVWSKTTPALDSANPHFFFQQNEQSSRFEIKFKIPDSYRFPETKQGDTLSISQFHLDFYNKNKKIQFDSIFAKQKQLIWLNSNHQLEFKTDKYQLLHREIKIQIEIPNYVFHSINAGESEFKIHFYQDSLYFVKTKGQIMVYDELIGEKIKLLEGDINFKFKVPEIYFRQIIMKDIELVTTVNADFSLIMKGYADIYWQIRNSNHIYYSSGVQSQAKIYYGPDTVNYYYLANQQNIKILVWDWDALSKDDIQGLWKGNLNTLDSLNELSFENVQKMHIMSINETKIN